MTLHPLTKELLSARFEYSPHRDEAIDKMVRGWAVRQAAWLKSKTDFGADFVDEAFQLTPETLEEKFQAIRLKHHRKYPRPEDFWDVVCKEFAKTAEEHFHPAPSGSGGHIEVGCLRPLLGQIGLIDDRTS